jgi:CheY-like chemotaxis protein
MPTILLVDDEASVRRVLRTMLELGGMRVVEAGSASIALSIIAADSVDAVVSDVLMPDTNGLAFYDQLVARAPHLRQRVVFLTGAVHDPAVLNPVESRGVPLISKLDDLMLVVDAVRLAMLKKN